MQPPDTVNRGLELEELPAPHAPVITDQQWADPEGRYIDAVVDGVLTTFPAESWEANFQHLVETDAPVPDFFPWLKRADVDAEAERRRLVGFMFAGKRYQADERSMRRITGMAVIAERAIASGVPGGLRWDGGDEDFGWIAADNTTQPMDAFDMIDFAKAAIAFDKAVTFAAFKIKNDPWGIPGTLDELQIDPRWPE